jgi:hypothetical protein
MDSTVAALSARGARFLVPPEPGAAVDGQIALFLSYNNLAVELIDGTQKTGWMGDE